MWSTPAPLPVWFPHPALNDVIKQFLSCVNLPAQQVNTDQTQEPLMSGATMINTATAPRIAQHPQAHMRGEHGVDGSPTTPAHGCARLIVATTALVRPLNTPHNGWVVPPHVLRDTQGHKRGKLNKAPTALCPTLAPQEAHRSQRHPTAAGAAGATQATRATSSTAAWWHVRQPVITRPQTRLTRVDRVNVAKLVSAVVW